MNIEQDELVIFFLSIFLAFILGILFNHYILPTEKTFITEKLAPLNYFGAGCYETLENGTKQIICANESYGNYFGLQVVGFRYLNCTWYADLPYVPTISPSPSPTLEPSPTPTIQEAAFIIPFFIKPEFMLLRR